MVDLPAPFGPTNPVTRPGLDGERQPVDGGGLAVALVQFVDFDHGTAKVRAPALAVVAQRERSSASPVRGTSRPGSLAWAMADNSGVVDRSDWPLISGLALGAVAVLEAIVYTGGVDDSERFAGSGAQPADDRAARRPAAPPPDRRGDGDRQHAVPAGLTAHADRGGLRRGGVDALPRRRARPARGLGTARHRVPALRRRADRRRVARERDPARRSPCSRSPSAARGG